MRLCLPVVLLALAGPLAAQQERAAAVPCRGQRIDSISVDAQAPTVTGLRRVPVVGSVVRRAHVVTRAEVVRRYMLLRPGDSCSEARRAESERILRAQPFLADATIAVVPSARGGVRLHVETIDEGSMILGGSVRDAAPAVRRLKLGSSNINGLGVRGSVSWRYQPHYDDGMEVRLTAHQLLGTSQVFDYLSFRDALARDDRAVIARPFRTDFQRLAWRAAIGESRHHALFARRDSGQLALAMRREYAEAGAMVRIGTPGALSLLGISLTSERSRPDTGPVRVTRSGLFADTAAALAGRFTPSHATRVNLLVGMRGIRFMRARALDALRGVHDVPLGIQVGGLLGRGVSAFGANTQDLLVASDLYAGAGSPRLVYRLHVHGEARRPQGGRGDGQWDGLVASGKVARHSLQSDRRTRAAAVEWSGASRVRVPHSLMLEAQEGGLRGYRGAVSVGNRRVVLRLDESWYAGSPMRYGDFGVAAFADAGRMWAGDLPYGENTRVRASAGAALLLAIPMRSTRTWRLEYAVPLNRVPGAARWELRLSHRDLTTFFWREPADIVAARVSGVPSSVYTWP